MAADRFLRPFFTPAYPVFPASPVSQFHLFHHHHECQAGGRTSGRLEEKEGTAGSERQAIGLNDSPSGDRSGRGSRDPAPKQHANDAALRCTCMHAT